MENHDADLVITGKYLLTQDTNQTIITNGGIAVVNDQIIETGDGQTLLDKYPDAKQIVEEHGLIMPGLINTHTHAAMACFRGIADDLPLMQWRRNTSFQLRQN